MSAPLSPRPNAQILDEAAAWFVEFSEGEVSSTAREAFSNWLRASPEHVRAYLGISATFADLGALDKSRIITAEALVRQALSDGNVVSLDHRLARPMASGSSGNANKLRPRALAAAATIAAVALGVATWQWHFEGIYSTGTGEQRLINLADGSTIELNAESRVRVNLRARQRNVELLEGQALFHVAKDPSRPFIVHSDTASVRAVGTQFDVNRERTDTIVTVLEGQVAIARTGPGYNAPHAPTQSGAAQAEEGSVSGTRSTGAPGVADIDFPTDDRPLYLSAGEQVILTAQVASKPAHPDVAAATAWRERKLIFSSSSLSDVAGEYNRYHEKRLRVADPALKDFKISGVFSAADATSLIAFLKAQPNIEVEEKASEIILKSR